MSLPWPQFWQHIPEPDRSAISDVLTELLGHGALLGDAGRDHELYLLARQYEHELAEYLAPLHLELVPDPDRPILQVRPVPGDCGLVARFNKAETLLVLTLWRMYHDARMERALETVVVTTNEIWHRLKLYFEQMELPNASQLRDMLSKLRNRRLVRLQWQEDQEQFGESQVEILPTLPRVIPFESALAWEQQAELYAKGSAGGTPTGAPHPGPLPSGWGEGEDGAASDSGSSGAASSETIASGSASEPAGETTAKPEVAS